MGCGSSQTPRPKANQPVRRTQPRSVPASDNHRYGFDDLSEEQSLFEEEAVIRPVDLPTLVFGQTYFVGSVDGTPYTCILRNSVCRRRGKEMQLALALRDSDDIPWKLTIDPVTNDPTVMSHALENPVPTEVQATLKGPPGVFMGTGVLDIQPQDKMSTARIIMTVGQHAEQHDIDGELYWMGSKLPPDTSAGVTGNVSVSFDGVNLGIQNLTFQPAQDTVKYALGVFYTRPDGGNMQLTVTIPDFDDWELEGNAPDDLVKVVCVLTTGNKNTFDMRLFDAAVEGAQVNSIVRTRTTNQRFSMHVVASVADARGAHSLELKFMQT